MFLYKLFSFLTKIFALFFNLLSIYLLSFISLDSIQSLFFKVKPFKKSVQLFILQGHQCDDLNLSQLQFVLHRTDTWNKVHACKIKLSQIYSKCLIILLSSNIHFSTYMQSSDLQFAIIFLLAPCNKSFWRLWPKFA